MATLKSDRELLATAEERTIASVVDAVVRAPVSEIGARPRATPGAKTRNGEMNSQQ